MPPTAVKHQEVCVLLTEPLRLCPDACPRRRTGLCFACLVPSCTKQMAQHGEESLGGPWWVKEVS